MFFKNHKIAGKPEEQWVWVADAILQTKSREGIFATCQRDAEVCRGTAGAA